MSENDESKAEDVTEEAKTDAVETAESVAGDAGQESAGTQGDGLTELMADGEKGTTEKSGPDLDAEALRAAQEAIAEGERALAEARARLSAEEKAKPGGGSKQREFLLRLLLVANVVAMIVVASLPTTPAEPHEPSAPVHAKEPTATESAAPTRPELEDKYNQALLASDRGDYAGALELLRQLLDEKPNLAESRRLVVYRQMAYYASIIGQYSMAQEFERKASMIAESHKLPEDLVAMAKAAHDRGDQEGLRQVWARFLLQQRHIPQSLYKHVAEAYLQLGDSYRLEANAAAEKARLEELRRTEELLRKQAGKKEQGR